ncbi:hypothetical protein OAM52_04615 [Flavobacteriaceae bacterium]|jgi:hypothetical protein|nr:hypothetical protein [Flavobacteriaceae bacterium]MDC0571736.1 hypothetical protein [Flavobacteriaceae bacterium]
MKKLLLLSALFVFACSGDNSSDSSNQTFFEKYDGVVWQEETLEDYLSRIQINNGNTITRKSYFVEDGDVYCDISTLLGSNFIEVNENSFSWNEQAEYNGVIETWITTVTATNNGNNLIIEYSDDPDYPEYYSRTTLTDPCE